MADSANSTAAKAAVRVCSDESMGLLLRGVDWRRFVTDSPAAIISKLLCQIKFQVACVAIQAT